jgi:dTDP-4-amino-4,6-dideoxygalactose transaminase
MKFVDLEFENRQAAKLARKNFDKIEKTGKYLLGNYLDKFEEDFAIDQNVNSAACVKNATDALYMTFKLLECEKRTIIVPGFGAYPTVVSAIQAGAKKIIAAPVDDSLTLDLTNVDVPKDSIIVPVHLFGNRASSPSIIHVANATNSTIIEDCAQSTGLEKMPESFAAIHSFYPTKPLGCRGDGGAIISNDEKFIQLCKKSRFYGLNDGTIDSWGYNSRMDEWQSAFLLEKIKIYRHNNESRKINAKCILEGCIESVAYTTDCVFHQLVTLWQNRDDVQKSLERHEIPTMIHYPKMLCDMPWLEGKVKFLECKRVADYVLSLPVGPHLGEKDLTRISSSLYELKNLSCEFDNVK